MKIFDILNEYLANGTISAWKVNETKTDSYELFFVHESLETVRATDSTVSDVTVYIDGDDTTGDSGFSFFGGAEEDDIRKKIEAAAKRAGLVKNQKYSLVSGGEEDRELPGNMTDTDMKVIAKEVADAVFTAKADAGASVNALEIFVYHDILSVYNSLGVKKKQSVVRVMIEAIPTFTEGKDSVELYEDFRFTTLDKEVIKAEISKKLKEVHDRYKAKKPEVPQKIDVVIPPHEIRGLVRELADDIGYASVYSHMNTMNPGDDIQKGGSGDKLNISLVGRIEGSERSAYFDQDGLDLTDTVIIENGIIKNNHGSNRFGQYLGVEKPSGILPCTKLGAGSLTEEEISKERYLEIVSMSGIQIDIYNDYIGGEIRLAYLVENGNKTPVTGITMSGSLKSALLNMRLADRTVRDGSYEGPAYMMIKEMEIL